MTMVDNETRPAERASDEPKSDPGRRTRRELTIAVLLCAVGAGLALWASTQVWADVVIHKPVPLPPVSREVLGRDAAPVTAALAWVSLAGALALLATKAIGRTVLGVFLALAALGFGANALSGMSPDALRGADAGATVNATALWPVLAVIGAVAVFASGVLTAWRARHWAASRRYQLATASDQSRPVSASDEADGTDTGAWDALDRGEDPTRER